MGHDEVPPAPPHHLSHNRKITFFLFGEPIGISENLVYAHDYNHVVIFEHIEILLSGFTTSTYTIINMERQFDDNFFVNYFSN